MTGIVRPRTRVVVVATVLGLLIAGALPALAAGGGQSATAPSGLVHKFPLGNQHLCCTTQTTSSGGSPTPGTPARSSPAPSRAASHGGGAGGSIGLIAAVAAVIAIVVAGAAVYARRGRPSRRQRPSELGPPVSASQLVAPAPAEEAPRPTEKRIARVKAPRPSAAPAPPVQPAVPDDQSLDLFEHALALHKRGDLEAAAAAYRRAEQQGTPDAAFNLGVLLYEAGDVGGAEDAWRRCLEYEHAEAATNLGFLLQQRGDLEGARSAYFAADRWGDPTGRRLAASLPEVSNDR